jgi:hypothetical protein
MVSRPQECDHKADAEDRGGDWDIHCSRLQVISAKLMAKTRAKTRLCHLNVDFTTAPVRRDAPNRSERKVSLVEGTEKKS